MPPKNFIVSPKPLIPFLNHSTRSYAVLKTLYAIVIAVIVAPIGPVKNFKATPANLAPPLTANKDFAANPKPFFKSLNGKIASFAEFFKTFIGFKLNNIAPANPLKPFDVFPVVEPRNKV
ncbi:Uncharacterised protein [Staphylococcus aureus]|nr:Uncharacterised protein [Staphylococcus aureus]CAC8367704.1 Uncharacterised protein [Staphylococcus aureus]SAN38838.1 Uncharacterised protein [Staphylococcus aureus]SCU35418.1 Uncharacterised protein [Staphylococcus aureus]